MTDSVRGNRFGGYQAGAAGEATVREAGGRWILVFVRELKHPRQRVWTALTDPASLREWAPFDPDRNLASTGPAELMLAGPERELTPAVVRRADEPALLEYTWGDDLLRWELEEIPGGTRLTLHHTMTDRTWLPKVTAGWHICIDVLERALDGRPVGRIVADDGKLVGWERLNAEYAKAFGETWTRNASRG